VDNRHQLVGLPWREEIVTLLMLQVNEALAFELTSLRARSGPGFDAELRQ